jgi:hypothetical protein
MLLPALLLPKATRNVARSPVPQLIHVSNICNAVASTGTDVLAAIRRIEVKRLQRVADDAFSERLTETVGGPSGTCRQPL